MKLSGSFLAAGALLMTAQSVLAQVVEAEQAVAQAGALPPLYQPRDDLERGLWMEVEEGERNLRTSQLLIHDAELNAYVRGVLCRTVGEGECRNIRLYLVHTPNFNAAMAPNGAMQVWSGLLLRTQNEAQLAAVLAHEYVHFESRHGVELFRQAKSKSNTATWLAFTGIGLIASFGLIGSLYKFSREQEREADLEGLQKLAAAGYDTREAAVIWEQLRDEMDATAAARGTKSRKDKNGGMFATHPPSAERVAYLRQEAETVTCISCETGADRYRAAMTQWWPVFVDDQMKMNDFGATSFLLDGMARATGWTPWLNYARGELYRRRNAAGDAQSAAGYFSEAIAAGAELPELWRGRGLALIRAGRQDEGRADLREYLARAPEAADRGLIIMMAGDVQ